MVDEKLIERAQGLLIFMGEVEAYDHLVNEGINTGCAFLAVKAAQQAPALPVKEGALVEAANCA